MTRRSPGASGRWLKRHDALRHAHPGRSAAAPPPTRCRHHYCRSTANVCGCPDGNPSRPGNAGDQPPLAMFEKENFAFSLDKLEAWDVYDTDGDLATSTTGSNATAYACDQLGHMTSVSSPSTEGLYEYEGDGVEAAALLGPSTNWSSDDADGSALLRYVSCAAASFCIAVDATWGLHRVHRLQRCRQLVEPREHRLEQQFGRCQLRLGDLLRRRRLRWQLPRVHGVRLEPRLGCGDEPVRGRLGLGQLPDDLVLHGRRQRRQRLLDIQRHQHLDQPRRRLPPATSATSAASSASFCMAVDFWGKALVFNGGWGTPFTADSHILDDVSCISTTDCEAVDYNGNAVSLTKSGSTWSNGSTNIDGSTVLAGLSCPTATMCLAVDHAGNSFVEIGGNWSAATNFDGTKSLDSVSCVTVYMCATVDTDGKTFITQASTQLNWDTSGPMPEVLGDGTNFYIYGDQGTPIEQVNVTSSPPSANPVFLSYVQGERVVEGHINLRS